MLLNLSNHPSTNWGNEQRQAAQNQFGGVVDMPFPHINPTATTAEVKQLAKEYQSLISHHQSPITAVHLMGELTFVMALVKLLQKHKMPVVASTTNRLVLEEKDGQKTVQFQFVQFRTYP